MGQAPGTLRLTGRSMILMVGMLGLTLLLLRVLSASTRVLGWLAVAALVAALLHPLVRRLDEWLPRGLAVAAVVLATVTVVGGMVYMGVDAVAEQARRLEREAPLAARRIERSETFGEAAREFELHEKVDAFVESLPDRLRGGTTAEALRTNATRGVAYLATAVLTIFLLIHGPRMTSGGLAQIGDQARRERLAGVLERAYTRFVRYVAFTLGRAVAAGGFGWLLSTAVGLPGTVLLGMTVGVLSIVPVIGVVVGSTPILLFAAADDPTQVIWVVLAVGAWQVVDAALVQPRLERRSLHVGPVLTLLAGMVGIEVYGVGGMIVAAVAVVFVAAVAVELAPTEESDLLAAADDVLPSPG